MRSTVTTAAWIGMAVATGGGPLLAQIHDNSEKQLTCNNGSHDSDRARHCEVREQSLPSIGRLSVDAGQNGGASIKGWLRNDVLVRARIEASGETEAAAGTIASRVMIDGSGGQVKATGPEQANNSGWSVSYEIFVPQMSDLTIQTHNGGISVSDMRGQIHFDAKNGGVSLKRVEGEVSGATVNGGIQVELSSPIGRQMDLKTQNGGVVVTVPSQYSANIQAETGMGRIQSDFSLPQNTPNANDRNRRLEFSVGAGGPPIRITTGNGSIRLKRAEAQ